MKKILGKKVVCAVAVGTLIDCLDERVARQDVYPLALGIANWRDELVPANETTVVFRDSAFADDVVKTNLAAILKRRGLENARSV